VFFAFFGSLLREKALWVVEVAAEVAAGVEVEVAVEVVGVVIVEWVTASKFLVCLFSS